MADLVVVDSDLLIDYLRGRETGARFVRLLLTEHRLRVTAVTAYELRVGADFLSRRDDVVRLLRGRTFPLDLASALEAGAVASALRQRGRAIGFADCLQAGVCLRYDQPLATRNRKHFSRVDNLRLVEVAPG
jgi:tRNA(fMet)-specific endonuclease VapC